MMKKIFIATTFILLVGICWSGYKWLSIKQINDRVTQQTKAAMVKGVMGMEDFLKDDTGFNGKGNATFFWSGINTRIENVMTSTEILKRNYKNANHEFYVINSIWWTFHSLHRFVAQTMLYYQDNQPFTLNSCEGIQIKNRDDIQNQFQKYKNLIIFPKVEGRLETDDEILKNIIDNWDIEQAAKLYMCTG